MKIKLNRALWNHAKGDTMEVDNDKAIWAISRDYAVKADPMKRKKKIDPMSEDLKNKSCK